MRIRRRVIVWDAADVAAESAFWAALLGGEAVPDGDWHSIVVDSEWVGGVQAAPDHVRPVWPTEPGAPQQQVHLDLHVDDVETAVDEATGLGATVLQPPRRPADNPDGDEWFAVLASPAGHPFCLGGH